MGTSMKAEIKTHGGRLPAELRASSLVLLKRLGFNAKQHSFDEYEKAGLSPYHHAILALLDEGVPETQAAIADSLGYDRGTLVGLLDELEEKGLVERKRDPDDRRRHRRRQHQRRRRGVRVAAIVDQERQQRGDRPLAHIGHHVAAGQH